MATRSVIGVMYGDVCKSVYCHWDGYLEGVGATLLENYGRVGASELIALGNISNLQAEIGVAHPFSIFEPDEEDDAGETPQTEHTVKISQAEYNALYGHMTTFYGRDRGEPDQEFLTANNFEEFLEQWGPWIEYMYIMGNDGQWYVLVLKEDLELVLLSEALAAERAVDQMEEQE